MANVPIVINRARFQWQPTLTTHDPSNILTLLAQADTTLQATLEAVSSLNADLSTEILLSASLTAESTLSASLKVPFFVANLQAQSTLAADLTTEILLSASLESESTLTADLLVGVLFTATLTATSTLTADLTLEILLRASLQATSTLNAGLRAFPVTGLRYDVSALGYEWHFSRRLVSRTYTNTRADAIALELIGLVPGFSPTFVEANLPTVDELTFTDAPINEALSQLADRIGATWSVNYDREVRFGFSDEDGGDAPTPLTKSTLSRFRNFSLAYDLNQTITRLLVRGTVGSVIGDLSAPSTEVQVPSLDGYEKSGGETTINGQRVTYTGTARRVKQPAVQNIQLIVDREVVDVPGAGLDNPGAYMYGFTGVTGAGETTIFHSFSALTVSDPNKGIELAVRYLTSEPPNRRTDLVRSFNIYRHGNGGGLSTTQWLQVGSIPADRAIARFVDTMPVQDQIDIGAVPPSEDTANEYEFFLTGVTYRGVPLTNPVDFTIVLNDLPAQGTLGALLGNLDDGIIERVLDVGIVIKRSDAQKEGQEYLSRHSAVEVMIQYETKDINSRVGKIVTVALGPPENIFANFIIQTVSISGFEFGVSPIYNVRASSTLNIATFERFMRRLGR